MKENSTIFELGFYHLSSFDITVDVEKLSSLT